MMKVWNLLFLDLMLSFFCQSAIAANLTLVAYNVESGSAEAPTVAKAIKKIRGVDVWGFSELAGDAWLETFENAVESAAGGTNYGKIIGTTGNYDDPDREPDYLAFLYNTKTLEIIDSRELHSINDRRHRSPLAASFRHKTSNQVFVVVLNHLASGNSRYRMHQTRQLREWVFFRESPVILMGDFNYRWKIGTSENNPPRDLLVLTRRGLLKWVEPEPIAHTWCGGSHNSVFDFVFVNKAAATWPAESKVIRTPCKKSDQTVSDHRPIWVRFNVP